MHTCMLALYRTLSLTSCVTCVSLAHNHNVTNRNTPWVLRLAALGHTPGTRGAQGEPAGTPPPINESSLQGGLGSSRRAIGPPRLFGAARSLLRPTATTAAATAAAAAATAGAAAAAAAAALVGRALWLLAAAGATWPR